MTIGVLIPKVEVIIDKHVSFKLAIESLKYNTYFVWKTTFNSISMVIYQEYVN